MNATLSPVRLLALLASIGVASHAALPAEPSFSCKEVEPGSIEARVCESEEFAALDRRLAEVYKAATAKAGETLSTLKAEQRGWVKGRNDCWKATDKDACIRDNYVLRIVELQASYRLVEAKGPVFFTCDGNPANEVVVTYFKTDPPSLIAERGDSTSLMVAERTASGAKYVGRNESFWEHQGVATIVWGFEAPEMKCVAKP